MIEEINNRILKGVADKAYPGCNYCYINGKDVAFDSFGNKALIPSVLKNDINTLYDLASVTKVVCTTTIILIMIDKGKLSLEDKVAQYLPEFKLKDITIRDLMSHQSGIAADVSGSWTLTKDEIYKNIMNLEYKYEPHTKVVYSDLGYIILGWIIEKIAGMSLDKVFKTCVADKLGMVSTGFNPKDISLCAPTELRSNGIVDHGHVHDEKAYHMNGVAGHAGLFSNVFDLAIYARMILNNGEYNGIKLISKETIDLIFTPQITTPDVTRTIGWIKDLNTGSIYHTGFTGTYILINREKQIALILLANRVHPSRENNINIQVRADLKEMIGV